MEANILSNEIELHACFIIACKYYRNFESLIPEYVDNICKFYPDCLIILIDNNSNYFDDIKNKLINYKNIVIITNNSECKFELGAYKVGINYLIDNNIQGIDYVFFTQDTFIIRNKVDLNLFKTQNITASACFAYLSIDPTTQLNFLHPVSQYILNRIGLQDSIHKLALCWGNSFVLHFSKITEFLYIVKDVVITRRSESCDSERFLSGILYYLNNNKISQIDDDNTYELLKHDDLKKYIGKQHFIKFGQFKTEDTKDI